MDLGNVIAMLFPLRLKKIEANKKIIIEWDNYGRTTSLEWTSAGHLRGSGLTDGLNKQHLISLYLSLKREI
jgi:hypothetical protein